MVALAGYRGPHIARKAAHGYPLLCTSLGCSGA